MAERAFRPQKSDPQRLFQREAAAHHFAINRLERPIGKRPLVQTPHALHDRLFAVGRINLRSLRLLELPDFNHNSRAGVEQFNELLIDLIDFHAQLIERAGIGHGSAVLAGGKETVKNHRVGSGRNEPQMNAD